MCCDFRWRCASGLRALTHHKAGKSRFWLLLLRGRFSALIQILNQLVYALIGKHGLGEMALPPPLYTDAARVR